MSYQVLARKWRPATFTEMVGQEHVLKALVNALDSGRLHHAYLFTGTRGVGKTSIARLFAKALNCQQGVSSTPCGECSACRAIAEGRFVDLIEVDAASRTKVEDTRELLENVQYAPTQGRFKVYLIDEVHMLSSHSFNALLKTLEEPPPHIKFLLATTDPQKLPVTILSRCLQFNLKNMSAERVVEHLKTVLEAEQVAFEESALWLLGRAAHGSMRDAMSLTDQSISFGNGSINETDVRAMLGSVDYQQVLQLLAFLANGNAQAVMEQVAAMAEFGVDFDDILAELISSLHRIAIAQMLPDSVDNSLGDREQILALAKLLRAEDVQLFYQIALNGRKDLPLVPVPREGLEMTLLRMLAFRPVGPGEQVIAEPAGEKSVVAADTASAQAAESSPRTEAVEPANEPSAAQPPVEPVEVPAATESEPVAVQPELPTPAAEDTHYDSYETAIEAPPPVVDDAPPWQELDTQAAASPPPVAVEPPPVPTSPPPKKPPAPEQVAAEAAGENNAIPELKGPQLSLAELDSQSWILLIDAIGISGMTYNIAANMTVSAVSGDRVNFVLPDDQMHLVNDVHCQRIADGFERYFGQSVTLEVQPGFIDTETPAQYQARRQQERQAEALATIQADENVQQLIERYGARIEQQTVKALDGSS